MPPKKTTTKKPRLEVVNPEPLDSPVIEVGSTVQEVQEWLNQFSKEQLRYLFLVLCGPSMMRKTQYAKSLFKNPFIHKDSVDWDGYDWLKHDAIIFDDVCRPDHIWKYVMQNRVLFQASQTVAVNTSVTNCYKRNVCTTQRPIVICTNDGLNDKYVTENYKQWLLTNCVWKEVLIPIRFECEPVPKDSEQQFNNVSSNKIESGEDLKQRFEDQVQQFAKAGW